MYFKKNKKTGPNLTDKSTNIEGHNIVRKNDVVTNINDGDKSVVASPNNKHVPTSTKDTSQQGDKLENESQKGIVENWSDKIRKFITTEDDGESSLDDFHDVYDASPDDRCQIQNSNISTMDNHTTTSNNEILTTKNTGDKNELNKDPMNEKHMDESIGTENSKNRKSTCENVSIETKDTNSILVPIPRIATMEDMNNHLNLEKQNGSDRINPRHTSKCYYCRWFCIKHIY